MKTVIWLAGLLVTSALFVGCNDKTNNNQTIAQPICPAGTYYTNGGCYGGTGYVGPSQYPMNQGRGFYADNYTNTGGSIRIVDAGKMQQFFKYGMGVCDRTDNTYGQASCDYFMTGQMDIVLQFPPVGTANTAVVTFIARPRQNPYMNYYGQLPSGWDIAGTALGMFTGIWLPPQNYYTGAYKPVLQLQMAVSMLNNNAGFEARGNGDAATGFSTVPLGIQVPQGKIEDYQLSYNFTIMNAVAAQGVMIRCQTPNCGL